MSNTLRRSIIAFVILALPLVASAQGFGRFGKRGGQPEGALVTGTVFTISGSTITILGGAVSIDATGAQVLIRGEEATLADVKQGSIITAILKDPNDTGILEAATIAVHDPPAAHLAGLVQAVDTTNKTFTILGLTIAVTDETSFGDRGPGAGLGSLADLQVNQPVGVGVDVINGVLTAVRVHRMAAGPRPGERLVGTVKSIGPESWVVTGEDGVDVTFVVNTETKIVGEPKVSDKVHVLYMIDSSNAKVALAIVRADLAVGPGPGQGPGQGPGNPPPPQPGPNHVSFDGVVKVISGQVWTIDATAVNVMPRTKITGNPQVNDTVHVEGAKRPDGTVTAFSIAKK